MSNSSSWDLVIPALVSGGFGAGLATVATALIQTWGKKGESRATAANLISDAAGALAARQSETIARLEARVDKQYTAIVALTSVIDELLPQVTLTEEQLQRLHKAVTAAKMAL